MSLVPKQAFFLISLSEFILEATKRGYVLTAGEFFRPEFVAEIYANQGKGVLHSEHTMRLAADLNGFYQGQILESVEDFKPLGELWKSYSNSLYTCCWGGDFTTRPDADHFSVENDGIK